jgi:hypothetical protein
MEAINGGEERDRTDDLLLAKQLLSQLSYIPILNLSVVLPSLLVPFTQVNKAGWDSVRHLGY